MNIHIDSVPGTKRQRTRDQLLVAAQEILLESGQGGIGIKEIAHRVGMVHATFYNYFPSVSALLDELSALFLITHGKAVGRLIAEVEDAAVVFARTTHLSLSYFRSAKGYGTILFDSGLPIDRFASGLRAALYLDISKGMASGRFTDGQAETKAGLISGAVIGMALDLHRGRLGNDAAPGAIEMLLILLGVPPLEARALAVCPDNLPEPPPLPLRWITTAKD